MKKAVVVGSGPNGLGAALTLARAGWQVRVLEGAATIGGGCRTAELTLPGFRHDICSAIHPLALASPLIKHLDVITRGVEWIAPPVLLAHLFDDGTAAALYQSIPETAASLGVDEASYTKLMTPLTRDFDKIIGNLLGPLRPGRHPVALARFGLPALLSVDRFTHRHFAGPQARAMFAGMAAHAMIPLNRPATASFGLVLALAGHCYGWPIPRGGSQSLIDSFVMAGREAAISFETGHTVTDLSGLDDADAILFDTAARNLGQIAGNALSARYRARLRHFRYGPGVFKIDWALSGPVPWTAPEANQAGTVHLGGPIAEIEAAEHAVNQGITPERPFVLVAQPSRFDPTRAPQGQQTLWAYCHVPHGSTTDMTAAIEAQIERFAPGFSTLILARATMNAAEMERHNPNYIGGDINGGVQDLRQLFTRPTLNAWDPYRTSNPRLYLCSSATPPGGGVHGMCGYHAARSAMRRVG